MNLAHDGKSRLFTGGELDPNDISAHEANPSGDAVGVHIGCHGDVHLAKVRQRGGFELLVHFFGGRKFGNSLCHGLKDS